MTLTHRRILYLCFFAIFFILSPVVILWAQGYRYNSYKHRLEKTGAIFLEFKPAKAEIYLDNKLLKKKTAGTIKYLLPDEYLVEIKKDNYQNWQRRLTINSSQTTFVKNIKLFKNQPAASTLTEQVILTSEAVNDTLAVVYKNKDNQKYTLAFLNLVDGKITPLKELNFPPTKMILSPRQSYVILERENAAGRRLWFFNANDKKVTEITDFSSAEENDNRDFSHLKWAANEEIIYGATSNSLKEINLAKKEITTLFNSALIDFQIIGNQIFTLEPMARQNKTLIKKAGLNKLTLREILTELPLSENYEFVDGPAEYLTILNKNKHLLYLVPTAISAAEEIKEFFDVNFAQWLNGLLLMANDFEMVIYNPATKEKSAVTRLSTLIDKALWHPDNCHVIYLNQNKIIITETDNYQKNVYQLVAEQGIKNFFINTGGNKIYFVSGSELKMVEIQ